LSKAWQGENVEQVGSAALGWRWRRQHYTNCGGHCISC